MRKEIHAHALAVIFKVSASCNSSEWKASSPLIPHPILHICARGEGLQVAAVVACTMTTIVCFVPSAARCSSSPFAVAGYTDFIASRRP